MPLSEKIEEKDETITVEDSKSVGSKSARSSSSFNFSKAINDKSKERFIGNIDKELSEDYSFVE